MGLRGEGGFEQGRCRLRSNYIEVVSSKTRKVKQNTNCLYDVCYYIYNLYRRNRSPFYSKHFFRFSSSTTF